MSFPVDISEIVRLLADSAPALARELFPAGVREGQEFRIGSLDGDKGRSMAIHLSGGRAGVWSDFASGEAGDALDLVAHALFGGDKAKAIRWARSWLGLDQRSEVRSQKPERPRRRAAAQKKTPDQGQRKLALRIWAEARESIKGTAADRYLQGRAIDLTSLGRQPAALRFHGTVHNSESGRAWPALLAAITGPDGQLKAVHRTWLVEAADGSVGKAPLVDPKMTLGRFRGGWIPIRRGADDDGSVIVTEGIEDALTVALARPELRVICAVSLANMGSLVLPENIKTVTICADNEWDNKQAKRGLNRAVAHFQGEGRKVLIARSPEGKDMNDLLRGTG